MIEEIWSEKERSLSKIKTRLQADWVVFTEELPVVVSSNNISNKYLNDF